MLLTVSGQHLTRIQAGPPSLGYAAQHNATVPDDTKALAALLPGARIEVFTLVDEVSKRSLATAVEAETAPGNRVLLTWLPATEPPVMYREISAGEELRLVTALRKHLPKGSTVLTMPDTSQRLGHFVSADWPLAAAEQPLLLPDTFGRKSAAISKFEAAHRGRTASEGADRDLDAFLDALLSEDAGGAARLRVLTGMKEAYVLVHLHDAFALGMIREGRLPMVRRLFTSGDFTHGLAREAKAVASQEDYAGYAIDRSPEGVLRGHFLVDGRDSATLIAQLLPFTSSRLGEVPGLRLVFQAGGYWLYRIAPVAEAGR